MQVQPLLVLCVSAIVTLLICHSFERVNEAKCTVFITGESVRIFGCEFTKDFVDFAKQARPFTSL
nr:triple gene block protein 3 [Shallot latent virus]